MANEIIINGKPHRYSWLNTIFVQVDDFDLMMKIRDLAQELDCDLEVGKEGREDLIAIPFFIGIVDRSLVGATMWEWCLEFRLEYGGHMPLIVFDTENGVDSIKTKKIIYTKVHNEILSIITKRKKRLKKIEFIYYNGAYKWLWRKWSELDNYWYGLKCRLSGDDDNNEPTH